MAGLVIRNWFGAGATGHRQARTPRDVHGVRRRSRPYCGGRARRGIPNPSPRGGDEGPARASQEKRGLTPIQVLARTGVLEAGALIAHGCGFIEADLTPLKNNADRTAMAACPKVYLKLAMGSTTHEVSAVRRGVLGIPQPVSDSVPPTEPAGGTLTY